MLLPPLHPIYEQFSQCEMIYMKAYRQVGDLNPYALDYPVCTEDASSKRGKAKGGRSQRAWLLNHLLNGFSAEAAADIRKSLKLEPVDSYEPCADNYMTAWLAQTNVKQAIHVKEDIEWVDCSRTIRWVRALTFFFSDMSLRFLFPQLRNQVCSPNF